MLLNIFSPRKPEDKGSTILEVLEVAHPLLECHDCENLILTPLEICVPALEFEVTHCVQ
jgi:hypothetical protein